MAGQRQADEGELLRQLGEMWDAAKAELAELRDAAQRAEQLGRVQVELTSARSQREVALLRLGEAFFKLVESGELSAPAALKRLLSDVKMKDIELLRQQADIAAILKEADALVEKSKKATTAKKKMKKE